MSGPLPWWGQLALIGTVALALTGMLWDTRRLTRRLTQQQQTNALKYEAEQIIYDTEFNTITRHYKDQP